MKKLLLIVLCFSLLTSFFACNKKDNTNKTEETSKKGVIAIPPEPVEAPEDSDTPDLTDTAEPIPEESDTQTEESEWVLLDSQIYDPNGNPIEEIPDSPIGKDALVQTIDDITGLNDIIEGYEYCYNYDFVCDESIVFEGVYYLVSDTALIEAYKAECAKYFEEGRFPPCFIEKEGKCFYRPVEDISLTMDMGEDGTGIIYSVGNTCELSYTDNLGAYHFIELTKGDNGFLISYSVVE